MDLALKKHRYEQLKLCWHECIGGDFSADSVVPDTMPDIREIIDTEGILFLRSKEAIDGRMRLAASIDARILYVTEEGDLATLSVMVPVEIIGESQLITGECRPVCRMRLRGLDGKMVNSRKVTVRADVSAEMWCYLEDVLEISTDTEPSEVVTHVRKNTAEIVTVADVREKAFVITDQYALPAGTENLQGIQTQQADVWVEDVSFVGGKAVFHGHMRTQLLMKQGSGELTSTVFGTDFSQIMEMDVLGEDVTAHVELALTGVYFDLPDRGDAGGKIGAEIHMAAQCVCMKKETTEYIEDLYSNQMDLAPIMSHKECTREQQTVTMRQTVTGRMDSGEREGDILCLWSSISGVSTEKDTTKTTISVRALFRKNTGEYGLLRCRLNGEFTTELEKNQTLRNAAVRVAEIYHSNSGSGADLRVVLQMDAQRVTAGEIDCVESVLLEESSETSVPSVTLVRTAGNPDLWHLAKRYHSSVEEIQRVNSENNSGLLLIPKSR